MYCVPKCPVPGKDNASEIDYFSRVRPRLLALPIDVPEIRDARVVHFPGNLMGHFYTFVWFRDPLMNRELKRAVRNHIHFREEVFDIADKVVTALGGDFSFSCIHVRRNDFQFKEELIDADHIMRKHRGHAVTVADHLHINGRGHGQ